MSENLWRGRCTGRERLPGRTEPLTRGCLTTGRWLEKEGGQCRTWTKCKVYVDTSRLMEESLRTASTILMATTRLWATRLSLMGSLSSERCYFLWVHLKWDVSYSTLMRQLPCESWQWPQCNVSPGTRNRLLQHLPRAAKEREDTKENRQT